MSSCITWCILLFIINIYLVQNNFKGIKQLKLWFFLLYDYQFRIIMVTLLVFKSVCCSVHWKTGGGKIKYCLWPRRNNFTLLFMVIWAVCFCQLAQRKAQIKKTFSSYRLCTDLQRNLFPRTTGSNWQLMSFTKA